MLGTPCVWERLVLGRLVLGTFNSISATFGTIERKFSICFNKKALEIISVSVKLYNYSIHFNQLECIEYPYYFIMVSLFQMNKIKGSYEPTRVY